MPAAEHRLRATRRASVRAVGADELDLLLERTARGDQAAFARVYDRCAGQVYGLVRRILRDPAQSEEVAQAQEVLLEVWRSSPRFAPARGSATAWIVTLAHRRAVDRVRSEQAARDRDDVAGRREGTVITTRCRRRSRSAWSTSRCGAHFARSPTCSGRPSSSPTRRPHVP